MIEQGFKNDDVAPCVFIKHDEDGGFTIIAIYVNDLNIIGMQQAIDHAKTMMIREFEMKDLGQVSHCIALQIEHFDTGILVHQTMYIQTIL